MKSVESPKPPDAPWRSGVQGARANLVPAVVLQVVAVALVLGYYYVPDVHGALARLAEFREKSGVGFGIVSTGLFGGLLPFLYIRLGKRDSEGHPRYSWGQGFWLTAFWAYKGLEVGIWYGVQAHVFGAGHDVGTIVVKVFMDQFVYCPAFAVPVTVAVYRAVDAGTLAAPRSDMIEGGWYRKRVLPVLLSNLGVWVPAVAAIYCLPTPLQLPMQNMVLCFYTLVVAHQMREPGASFPDRPGDKPVSA